MVDLAHTTFLDSTSLGVLVGAAKLAAAQSGWLRLAAATHPSVQRILEITQLNIALGLYPSVEAAIVGDTSS